MGRKSKQKKRKLNYTKTEFQQVFCNKCMICPAKTEPTFCFDEVYKNQPKLFVRVIFNRLIQSSKWLLESGQDAIVELDDIIEKIFTSAFCSSGVCASKHKHGCEKLVGCLMAFRSQIRSGPKVHIDMSAPQGKKPKKQKNKGRYIAKPYPTFFCNEPFKTEIEELLNGNRDSKQNKIKRPPSLLEKSASRAAESSESQVPGSPGRW